ncbi:glycosyltransferase family 4 protein [Paenibacillus sp. N1-5-1-14]|uniref:glycosyltransferase family 4 protein n=1 Tax=Paenibacillus radicibacter TaxID=2972488 RepID=UPI0021591406|nr:glycosyltransferase family 4 protein [Paenibacillus radicibacter]MCR8645186.1 glycosyltransferase family 4 protein [Paenibacillus radicibacter]
MKILLATYWLIPHLGGVWTVMEQMKRKLEQLGHEVDIFGNSPDGKTFHMPFTDRVFDKNLVLPLIQSKINKHTNPVLLREEWISTYEIDRYCMELAAVYFGLNQYDVIHTHDIISTYSFSRIKPKHTALVATLHGSVGQEVKLHLASHQMDMTTSLIGRYHIAMEHFGATTAQVTLASSQWMRNLLVNEYSVPAEKVRVYQYGYDSDTFFKQLALAKPIHRPTGKKVILFTGRLVHIKGIDYLLDALGVLKKLRQDWVCWIAGDGAKADALKKKCWDLGIQHDVEFLGRRDDVAYLLTQSDIFAQPSIIDNQPLSLIEAQIAGKPAVISNGGGLPEMVVHENTGLVHNVGDSQTMAYHLHLLVANDQYRTQMGINAKNWGTLHWSLDTMIARTVAVYQEFAAIARM